MVRFNENAYEIQVPLGSMVDCGRGNFRDFEPALGIRTRSFVANRSSETVCAVDRTEVNPALVQRSDRAHRCEGPGDRMQRGSRSTPTNSDGKKVWNRETRAAKPR